VVFGLGKAIKFWAIASLGARWSFRVLVLPGAPLVTSGPYRWMRHPNYVGVMGELVGVAIALLAFVTGTLAIVVFGWVLVKRIRVEDRALQRP
jgi:methyltransferase